MEYSEFSHLEEIRKREHLRTYYAYRLTQDPELLAFCVSWPGAGAQWDGRLGVAAREKEIWLELWEGCTVQPFSPETFDEVCASAGLCYEDARRLFLMARRMFFIYPDGTVAAIVRTLAQQAVVSAQMGTL